MDIQKSSVCVKYSGAAEELLMEGKTESGRSDHSGDSQLGLWRARAVLSPSLGWAAAKQGFDLHTVLFVTQRIMTSNYYNIC